MYETENLSWFQFVADIEVSLTCYLNSAEVQYISFSSEDILQERSLTSSHVI